MAGAECTTRGHPHYKQAIIEAGELAGLLQMNKAVMS
jgi:hypothetical protein